MNILASKIEDGRVRKMGKIKKLYEHILMRRSDANVSFETMCLLLKHLGSGE